MNNSFFFLQAEKSLINEDLITSIENWSTTNKIQTYVINKPLGENKYTYSHQDAFVLLIPTRKLSFIDFSGDEESFESFIDDFIEDLGSISDKYRYKDAIGRPRKWRNELVATFPDGATTTIEDIENKSRIDDPGTQRIGELLISLLTGSINDIQRVKAELPESLLDKVKRKIILFDGDQTRFVYQKLKKTPIRIQGLSGTGKTELLLHKMKELYIDSTNSRIALTCHNKILAHNLRRRIPDFFNFMKVEQQIKWNDRLWCIHAWGSESDINSGTYRYICNFYGLPFFRWGLSRPFDKVCSLALEEIKKIKDRDFAFDYILIDESQDFPDSFFELCQTVTQHTVYIAGDIFQSIFDESITDSISPDFLLSKCYRTDPRTLMFAHALGMGLFENKKLRWLEDKEWADCGYILKKDTSGVYKLKREPLRRFEDIDKEHFKSVEICATSGDFYTTAPITIVGILQTIARDNPTVTPDDIGIILLDNTKRIYAFADTLEQFIYRELGWQTNKAYESKEKLNNSLFMSNKNNVKGLEFPFVVCVTEQIGKSYSYRNALYMTLTRSFLQSYLVVSEELNGTLLPYIQAGLNTINLFGHIEVMPPDAEEKERIKTTIKFSNSSMSFFDFVNQVFDDLEVPAKFRANLRDALTKIVGEDFDYDNVKETVEFLYEKILRRTP